MWDQPGVYKDYSLYLKNILEYWIKGQGNKINVDGNKTLHQWVSFQENFSGDIFLIRIFIFFLVFFYAPQDPIKSLKKTCLQSVWWDFYTLFECKFALCLKKCLHHVRGHVYHIYQDIFTWCFGNVYSVF